MVPKARLWAQIFMDACMALAKQGDNVLGSVCPSVCLFVCALLFVNQWPLLGDLGHIVPGMLGNALRVLHVLRNVPYVLRNHNLPQTSVSLLRLVYIDNYKLKGYDKGALPHPTTPPPQT